MVRGVGDETEWRQVLVEIGDFLRRISRRLDQVEEQLDRINERLDRMEGVEEEFLEGEMVDKERVDGKGNRKTENGKTDGENGRTREDVEMEGEK